MMYNDKPEPGFATRGVRTKRLHACSSESERDSCELVQRHDSVRTESSYKLLEENMTLLNKLKLKGDICR